MTARLVSFLRHPLPWFALALVVLPFAMVATGATVLLATEVACFTLLALALNLLLGHTGLLSFGHGLFFGFGAYTAALLQIHLLPGQMFLPFALGTVATGLLGLVIGALVLRKSGGVYFALLTLAFAMVGFYLVYRSTDVTGGENGLGGFAPVTVLGIDYTNRANYYYLTAFVVFVAAAVLWRFSRSPYGEVLRAIRENEERVRALGYNTYRYKLAAFTVSALFTGLAGGLYGYALSFAYANLFHATFSGQAVAMTIVGGMGWFFGPAVGAVFFVYVREGLSAFTSTWMFFFGLMFMAFILFNPQGITGLLRLLWRLLTGRRREVATAAPEPGASGAPDPEPVVEATFGDRSVGAVLLSARQIVRRFDGFTAVDGVDLDVRSAEIHGLIGPNGAGKTTFFNCLCGALPVTSGQVFFDDRDVTDLPTHKVAQLGVARSFQIVSTFSELTVFENVRVAVQAATRHKADVHTRAATLTDVTSRSQELVDQLGLSGKEHLLAGTLSHGDQRLLDITLALATEPTMLLLDEPFAGLPSSGRAAITEVIRDLNHTHGMTILLIEHDIERVLELADVVTVLHQGRVLASGPPDQIRDNPQVQDAYMGTKTIKPVARGDDGGAPVLLELDGVDAFYDKSQALERVSLRVHSTEVVCLLGLNGAGKTTTLMSVMGAVPVRAGQIRLDGTDMTNRPSEAVAQAGVGLVPQGRRVFANLTVQENLKLASRSAGNSAWTIDRVYERLPALHRLRRRSAGNLSGGERQMLAIARALVGNPRMLLLDEPFEGLAQSVVNDIVEIIRELREELTILLVEQNFELALSLADRAYVISGGRIVHEAASQELLDDPGLGQRLIGV